MACDALRAVKVDIKRRTAHAERAKATAEREFEAWLAVMQRHALNVCLGCAISKLCPQYTWARISQCESAHGGQSLMSMFASYASMQSFSTSTSKHTTALPWH